MKINEAVGKIIYLHQLQSSARRDSDAAHGDIRPTILQDTTAQELTCGVSDPPNSIDPVARNCGDKCIAADVTGKRRIV